MVADNYTAHVETPSVADYRRLRVAAGLSPRSEAAAAAGLPRTAVGVVVRRAGRAVGMGRAVGDGLFYQLVDIAVEPAHQGRGVGKTIVSTLMREPAALAPAEAYVSLIADGRADQLYARHGFAPTPPRRSAWRSGSAGSDVGTCQLAGRLPGELRRASSRSQRAGPGAAAPSAALRWCVDAQPKSTNAGSRPARRPPT